MIGFRWVRVIRKLKAFDDLSQERHENCGACHIKEIGPCHHRTGDGERKEFFDMRVDPHPKGVKEADEEKENLVTERVPHLYSPGQWKETEGIKA